MKSGDDLHKAAQRNDSHKITALLGDGADVNAKNGDGFTALHCAAWKNAFDAASLLLENGADVNAGAPITPLWVAAQYNAKDVAGLLITMGASPNTMDKDGWTVLHVAAQYNAKDVVGVLLSKGAKVNAADKGSFTPLHVARNCGARDVYALLCSQRASTTGILKRMFGRKKSGATTFKCYRCTEQIEVPDTDKSGINVRVKCKSCGGFYLIRSTASCNADGGIVSSDGKQMAFLCDRDGTPF